MQQFLVFLVFLLLISPNKSQQRPVTTDNQAGNAHFSIACPIWWITLEECVHEKCAKTALVCELLLPHGPDQILTVRYCLFSV